MQVPARLNPQLWELGLGQKIRPNRGLTYNHGEELCIGFPPYRSKGQCRLTNLKTIHNQATIRL